jgi:hypothetical protein
VRPAFCHEGAARQAGDPQAQIREAPLQRAPSKFPNNMATRLTDSLERLPVANMFGERDPNEPADAKVAYEECARWDNVWGACVEFHRYELISEDREDALPLYLEGFDDAANLRATVRWQTSRGSWRVSRLLIPATFSRTHIMRFCPEREGYQRAEWHHATILRFHGEGDGSASAARTHIARLTADLDSKREEVNFLESARVGREEAVHRATEATERARAAEAQTERAEARLKEALKRVTAAEAQRADAVRVKERLADSERNLATAQAQLAETAKKCQGLQTDVRNKDQLVGALNTARQEVERLQGEVQRIKDAAEMDADHTQNAVAHLEVAISTVRTELSDAHARLKRAQENLSDAKTRVTRLAHDTAAKDARIRQLTADLEAKEELIMVQAEVPAGLTAEVAGLEARLCEVTAMEVQARRALTGANGRIAVAEERTAAAERETQRLRDRLRQAEEKTAALTAQVAVAERRAAAEQPPPLAPPAPAQEQWSPYRTRGPTRGGSEPSARAGSDHLTTARTTRTLPAAAQGSGWLRQKARSPPRRCRTIWRCISPSRMAAAKGEIASG